MPSLTLIPEAARAFDTVGGRIIVAAAEGIDLDFAGVVVQYEKCIDVIGTEVVSSVFARKSLKSHRIPEEKS